MYKIKILTARKHKETWLQEGIDEYTKRLKNSLQLEWVFAKDSLKLEELISKEGSYIALSPDGKPLSSVQFSHFLISSLEQGGSRLVFVIGDAEGLGEKVMKSAKGLISLSPLTFTHQLTRLILLEQLYRAIEISKNSSYHK